MKKIYMYSVLTFLFGSSSLLYAQNETGTGFPYFVDFTKGTQPKEAYKPVVPGAVNNATFTKDGLKLTDAIKSSFGAILLSDQIFKNDEGIKFEFEYVSYNGTKFNGSRGDGFSIFLIDGDIPKEQLNIGANGAGLGYSYNAATNKKYTTEGLRGAFLGIGFDEFGNFKKQFYQSEENRNGISNYPKIEYNSHITLRGKRDTQYRGYPVLYTVSTTASKNSSNRVASLDVNTGKFKYEKNDTFDSFSVDIDGSKIPLNEEDPNYRKAFVTLEPSQLGGYNITVKVKAGNTLHTVIENYYYPIQLTYEDNSVKPSVFRKLDTSPPKKLRIGFAGSTGAATNIHLLKNLGVSKAYAAEATDDLYTTCKNKSITTTPLDNDIAYSILPYGKAAVIDGEVVKGNEYIDYKSFRFLTKEGESIPNNPNYTYTSEEGTWAYNINTGELKFTPVSNFEGIAYLRYDIKGGGRDGNEVPFNQEDYRSFPALIQVQVINDKTCSKSFIISNQNVTSKIIK
ncbi:hypothetical protein [Empedobacter tilapiae]